MKLSYIVGFLGCMILSACQLIDSQVTNSSVEEEPSYTFNNKITMLVDELTSNATYDYIGKSTLITTFVWSDSLTYKDTVHPLKHLGYQLAEGIKIGLVQKDALVVEHQSSKFISIDKHASYFLSRETDDLNRNINAHYIVAGTFTEIEGGALVYAEVVEFTSGNIVSAGQEFIPKSVYGPTNIISSQDGMLYRREK